MERKLKICSDCGKPSVLWRSTPKLCKYCAGKPKHQKLKKEKMEVKQGLNVFFASQALQIPANCENCGHPLNVYTSFDKRKVTAHILPKTANGGFPSVAVHPQNRMFLCCMEGSYCHEKWDHGDASDRITMKVYDVAIKRFEAFKSLLSPKELIKANKYLNLEL